MKGQTTRVDNRPSSRTVPSNRLSHGLNSRAIAEARTQQVRELAQVLIRDAPRTFEVVDAAHSLAGAMLHLVAVRSAKKNLLTTGDVTVRATSYSKRDDGSQLKAPPDGETAEPGQRVEEEAVASMLERILRDADNVKMFVRLYEYERKAISLRNRLLRRFDFAVFEAYRKQGELKQQRRS